MTTKLFDMKELAARIVREATEKENASKKNKIARVKSGIRVFDEEKKESLKTDNKEIT